MLFAPLVLMTLDVYATAVVWTDKADYAPWETVTIYGSGFNPNTNIDIAITKPDSVVDTGSTMSDAFGSFIYYYIMNGIVGTYTVTATDGTNTASTTFTESDHVDWVHGRDDTDNNGVVDTPMVTWHTGAINAQNSIFTEGNIVPTYPPNVPGHVNYRAIIEDKNLGPGTYVLTIQYEFTKGGKVAFDFLTTNYGITDSNLQTQLPSWADSSKISSLVTAGPSTATFPNDGFSLPSSLGSGFVQDRQNAHDTVFTGLNPRKMKLYGATITGITQGSHSGPITGNSDATVAVTFIKSTDETWPIIATWGGHLGIGAAPPVGYGTGNGAGSVSGAPFHMSLGNVVNTQTGNPVIKGKRDLAVQIGAITPPPGTGNIVVEKITLGGVDTFNFVGAGTTLPPGFSSFSITTVTPGVAVSTGFTNVNPGTYTVTEQALAGWDLTGITIIDPDGGSGYTGSTATLDIDSGETVTVTFTDTKRGKIIVDKITVPAADPQSFGFGASGPNSYSASFSLTDAQTPWDSGWLKPGIGYSVTETVPADWDLTSAVCSDGSPVDDIILDPGETVIVTFTNERALPGKASIGDFVWKDLDIDGLQDAGEPGFQGVTVELYTSTHTLVGTTTTGVDGSYSFTNLDPGNYYLKFYAPSGYVFSPQDQGTDDAEDSDADPSTGQTAVTTLTSSETDNTWDAGMHEAPVGGLWVPINKFELLAPWIILTSLMTVSAVSIVYAKHRKR